MFAVQDSKTGEYITQECAAHSSKAALRSRDVSKAMRWEARRDPKWLAAFLNAYHGGSFIVVELP